MNKKANLKDTEVAKLKMDDNIVMQLGSKMYNQSLWWVILRELIQNSLDAKATSINVETDFDEMLVVSDNGIGMTKEELLGIFLTVGGSHKEKRADTVGGFGVAKLAIFSCEDFHVVSNTWSLTKDVLINHEPVTRVDNVGQNGTWVKVRNKNMFGYNSQRETEWYLRCINRPDVHITLNGNPIVAYKVGDFSLSDFGNVSAVKDKSANVSYAYIMVRTNGLPVFKSNVYGANKTITFIYDVETDLDPYDPDYPFTITRDDFSADNEEKNKYLLFSQAIDNHFRKMSKIAEAERTNLTYDSYNNIWLVYGATPTSENLEQLKSYKRAILLLAQINSVDTSDFEFGLCKGKNGAYIKTEEDDSKHIFFISDKACLPTTIVATAIHEYSHKAYRDHYESFAEEMTSNVAKFLTYLSISTTSQISYDIVKEQDPVTITSI